jgi:hypothetical protein
MTFVWKGYRKLWETCQDSWSTVQDSDEECKEYTVEVAFDDMNLDAPE